ncbi:MAG: efflux RND transporter periplasmic adaptor subunit [Proteobacteria bacterium]|nr:efflux RND transporter periplasmic adaptor subunit [Pseudomonadota bacterium]
MKILITTLILLIINTDTLAQWHKVTRENIDTYRYLNGEIEAVNKATVSSQTTGRVEKLHYDVDDLVTKDSIIVEFTNTEQKAKLNQSVENANAAKIAYQQAATDYNRIKDIFAKKLVAKSQLDQALSNKKSLQSRYKAAQSAVVSAKKQHEYTVIRAPYDGIVTKRFVEQGEVVNPGTPIMEGLSLNKLRVITYIPEKIINQVKANPYARVTVTNKQIDAKNITIFPYADRASRTFKTRIDIDTQDTPMFPGMTVKVAFKVGAKTAIIIPHSAVVHRSELTMVYVKNGDGKLLRHIKLGSTYGEGIEVISGLDSEEEIFLNPLSKSLGR